MKYLLESSISMMLLYTLYFFVFRNFTFIRLNRIYLLLSLVFSLLIPNFTWEVTELASTPQKLVDFTQFYSLNREDNIAYSTQMNSFISKTLVPGGRSNQAETLCNHAFVYYTFPH